MNILLGARYLLRGYRLLFQPGLRRFFVFPLAINILVLSLLVWLAADRFTLLLDWLVPPAGEAWWAVLGRAVLWIVFAVAALLTLFFTFTVLANLIAAPFNGLLAEKVFLLLTGKKPADGPRTFGAAIAATGAALSNEVGKIAYFLSRTLPLFAVVLIPVVNVVFPFLWAALTAWMLAAEYLSYPMENEGLSFRQARERMARKRGMSFGFGIAVTVATMTPVINLLVMPAAVAGATLLWVEIMRAEEPSERT